jgi:hypothetical protein
MGALPPWPRTDRGSRCGSSRRDDGRADPEFGDLGRERLGEADHRELGRRVHAPAVGTAVAADRGDIENPPGSLCPHEGQHRTGHVHQSEQICVELGADFVGGGLLERAELAVPGVVHQHVDTSKRAEGDPRDLLCLIELGHVQLRNKYTVGGHVPECHVEGLRVPGRRDHLVPSLQRSVGDRHAQTASSTRHEPYLRHHSSPLFSRFFR